VFCRFKIKDSRLKIIICCLLLTIYCLLFSCATTENLDLLRQETAQLRKESLTMKNELTILKEKTTGVAREDSFNVVRQSQAEIQSMLSNVSKDIQILSGRFDENKYFTEKALKDSAAEMELIKVQITSLEGQIKNIKEKLNALESRTEQQKEPPQKQLTETEKKVEEPEKEPQYHEEQPAKPVTSNNKTAKYEAAYNAFKDKKYKEARKKFEVFIKEFPKDELADNAQFWIAESFYGEKDFEGAILAYETLLKKYPNSKKAPAALLKQGLSFIEIGDKKTGKVILEQLTERYPDSKEAGIARKNIEDTKKNTGKKKK
jgi:tol-pal system protein YbgF